MQDINRLLRGVTILTMLRGQRTEAMGYRRRPRPGDRRHLEEVFIRIEGVQHYLWRAVDEDDILLDALG